MYQAALRESVVEVEYQCKLEKTNSLLAGVSEMLDVQSERYQTLLYNQKLLNLTTTLFDAINTSNYHLPYYLNDQSLSIMID